MDELFSIKLIGVERAYADGKIEAQPRARFRVFGREFSAEFEIWLESETPEDDWIAEAKRRLHVTASRLADLTKPASQGSAIRPIRP